MDKILLVGLSSRAMAESAVGAGYRCTAIDYFGDLDRCQIVRGVSLKRDLAVPWSMAGVLRAARKVTANRVAFGSNLENHPGAVSRLSRERHLLGSGPASLRGVRDPARLREALRRAGVRMPMTLGPDATRRADPGTAWIRKRRRSGGGARIAPWQPGQPVREDEVVQALVEGTPASAACVGNGRAGWVLGVTRQLIGDPAFGVRGYRYCGSIWPLTDDLGERESVRAEAARAADVIASAFRLKGVFGIDFIARAGGIEVLEVNPRFTASMELIERARGIRIFDVHARSCLEGRSPDPPSSTGVRPSEGASAAHGKAILFARSDLRLGDTEPWGSRGIRDVPWPGDRIRRGAPICTLFARAPSPEACEALLRARAHSLEEEIVTLSNGRRDDPNQFQSVSGGSSWR